MKRALKMSLQKIGMLSDLEKLRFGTKTIKKY